MTHARGVPTGQEGAPTAGAGPPPATDGGTGGPAHHAVDWERAVQTPEFGELARRRRSFVVPATLFFLAWYFGFIVLAGYAEDFMGREFIWDGLTVGYVLALTQFLMVWGLVAWYLRRANRVFDPLAERAAARAIELSGDGARFERAATDGPTHEEVSGR